MTGANFEDRMDTARRPEESFVEWAARLQALYEAQRAEWRALNPHKDMKGAGPGTK